jgi:hypothetical protein
MGFLIGFFSLVGLALTLFVHGSTFVHTETYVESPLFIVLHVGAIAAGAATIPIVRRLSPGTTELRAILPRWAVATITLTGAYATLNFLVFLMLCGGSGPEVRGGEYVMQSHGKVVRHISETEYHQQKAYLSRGFSGGWAALFTYAALIGFAGRSSARNKGRGDA